MRLIHAAVAGLFALATAKSNLTQGSKNVLPSTFQPPQHFRNTNLVRNINLEKNYPRETINVVVENIDKQPQSEYYLPFEQHVIGRIGGLEAKDKKDASKAPFNVEIVALDEGSSTEYYKITLPSPLATKEQITLSITYFVLSALDPIPAQILQNDKQYVQHKFSAYAPSAYTTLKQKTKLKLPTTDVPDATVLPADLNTDAKEDPQKQGTAFTYGPYGELPAGAQQEVSVRYEFTKALTHGTLLERDIEVSHWGGNVATEERHWLTNRAAKLKNHFSRVTYQQANYFNPPSSALKEMRFPLAIGSVDAYFVDDIGNVSTSRFRTNEREANLELKPRYPVYGGWNYSFKTGWNADLKTVLHAVKGQSEQFVLKVPFIEGPRQNEGVEYERVVTRVILPEGAIITNFETSVPLISNTTTLHRTFMDTVGRTTLNLVAINVVDELRERDLFVTYEYPSSAKFRKPLALSGGLFVLFLFSWVIANLDASIGKKQKQKTT